VYGNTPLPAEPFIQGKENPGNEHKSINWNMHHILSAADKLSAYILLHQTIRLLKGHFYKITIRIDFI